MRFVFCIAAIGVVWLGQGLARIVIDRTVAAATFQAPDADNRAQARWVFETDDPDELTRAVDTIVVARPQATSIARVAPSANGRSGLEFEQIAFDVERIVKPGGSIGPGTERITVERARRSVTSGRLLDHDGGAYEPGARYLLFLKQQPDSSVFYLVNDQGRYRVGPNNRLQPAARGRVADAFRGRLLSESVAAIGRALAAQ